MKFDPDTLAGILTHGGDHAATWHEFLAQPPVLRATTAGASTLRLEYDDPDNTLTPLLPHLSVTVDATGTVWAPAAVRRRPGRLAVTCEDATTRRLRAVRSQLTIPAGSTTINELITRLADEAGPVGLLLEDTRQTLTAVIVRTGSSWDMAGEAADRCGRWRFVDDVLAGLVVASPAWLLANQTGGTVDDDDTITGISWQAHTEQGYDTAGALLEGSPPRLGSVATLTGVGPVEGDWLVSATETTLGGGQTRVTWTRPASGEGLWS